MVGWGDWDLVWNWNGAMSKKSVFVLVMLVWLVVVFVYIDADIHIVL